MRAPVMEQSLREAIIVDYARRRPGSGVDGGEDGVADAATPSRTVRRRNPLCGDEIELRLGLTAGDDPMVARLRWAGRGCTVSQASAAMLASRAGGMTTADLRRLSRGVHELIVDQSGVRTDLDEADDLAALAGIGRFPLRARCAALAWDALDEAIGLEARDVTGPDRGPR
ncbi:iron-sulfur cluster assembly scaffold protein [Agromyces bauzanensis]